MNFKTIEAPILTGKVNFMGQVRHKNMFSQTIKDKIV